MGNVMIKISLVDCENGYLFVGSFGEIEINVGSILIEISEIHPASIREMIEKYNQKNEKLTKENIDSFSEWIFNELQKKYTFPTAFFIKNIFNIFFSDYLEFGKEEISNSLKKIANTTDGKISTVIDNLEMDLENFAIAALIAAYPVFNAYSAVINTLDIENESEEDEEKIYSLFNILFETLEIDYRITLFNKNFVQGYSFKDFSSFLAFDIHNVLKKGVIIKKCANCGKYFIPLNRSDTIYCDRISPKDSSLTCKEYGSQKLWYDKLKADKTAKLYRNIYMAKQMLVKRNPDIKEYQEDFNEFKNISKQWKKDVKEGTKTEEEFVTWLKSVRGRKYLD